MFCKWLRELFSSYCLTVLPSPAWMLLIKVSKYFYSFLYSDILDSFIEDSMRRGQALTRKRTIVRWDDRILYTYVVRE